MNYNPHVFISYSQHDGDAAASLLDLLESAGVSCFLAEKSIAPGIDWDSAIRNAILQADRIIVLVTPNSKDSIWVAAEVGAAWILGKSVIPALQSIDAKELKGPLGKYQACKAETSNEISRLIQNIIGSNPKLSEPIGSLPIKVPLNTPEFLSFNESFTNPDDWNNLLKVGEWHYNTGNRSVTGKGIYRYLLSHHIYGNYPFTIKCRLTFLELFPENSEDAVNAGIILGWSVPTKARRYYHIAFSGTYIFLERIGTNDGDDYWDYEHLSKEVPFLIEVNKPYEFFIMANSENLSVYAENKELINVKIPINLIVGRLGLRPWRSILRCDLFCVEITK